MNNANSNMSNNLSIKFSCGDLSSMGLNALVRAAEISPFIHDRSIGVDQNFSTEAIISDNYKYSTENTTEAFSKGTCDPSPTNSDTEIDDNTLRYFIIFKNAEQNRKLLVKTEIEKTEKRYRRQQEMKTKEITKRIYHEKQYFVEKRIERDQEVLKEVNKLAENELEELDKTHYNSYNYTKKSLKELLDSLDKTEMIKNVNSKEQIELGSKVITTNLSKQEIHLNKDLNKADDLNKTDDLNKSDDLNKTDDLQKPTTVQNHMTSGEPKNPISLPNLGLSKNENLPSQQLIDRKNSDEKNTSSKICFDRQNPTQTPSTKYISEENFKFYTNLMMFYNEKLERADKLQNDENAKEYRTLYRQAIYTPINAIGAVSAEHLRDKYEKLLRFMTGQPHTNTTTKGTITINSHPLGTDFCVLLMVKKFVNQGETSIASNAQSAYAFASVAISLWKKIPDFGTLLIAHFFKKSPFLVPYIIPESKGQTVEDYCKLIGFYVSNGEVEDNTKYLKRLTGLIRLYSALMITAGTNVDGPDHPFSIENGWKWLCNLLNLTPIPDICPTLILEFLQTAGWAMLDKYGKQFHKLLYLIQHKYLPLLADRGGPKTRLEGLLKKLLSTKQVPKPVGLLSPNFW